jgi:hypothetical protein
MNKDGGTYTDGDFEEVYRWVTKTPKTKANDRHRQAPRKLRVRNSIEVWQVVAIVD